MTLKTSSIHHADSGYRFSDEYALMHPEEKDRAVQFVDYDICMGGHDELMERRARAKVMARKIMAKQEEERLRKNEEYRRTRIVGSLPITKDTKPREIWHSAPGQIGDYWVLNESTGVLNDYFVGYDSAQGHAFCVDNATKNFTWVVKYTEGFRWLRKREYPCPAPWFFAGTPAEKK